MNDACLRWIELDAAAASRHPQIEFDAGRFFETGLSVALRYLRGFILGTERFRSGLDRMRQVVRQGGHTTIGDAAFGFYGFEAEWDHLQAVMEQRIVHATLQSALSDAARKGTVARNVADTADPPSISRSGRSISVWTGDHLRCFLDAMADHELY